MKIRWLGHACFLLESQGGTKIVIDPFDGSVGYKIPKIEADAVTVSHDHYDHNYVEAVQGDPKIIRDTGLHTVGDISIEGIASYHDEVKGEKRGDNIIFTYSDEDIILCHMGDLGHLLSKAQADEIGEVDVLLIPVGGTFTLDAEGAVAVIEQISPKLVIPMHFATPAVNIPIDPVDKFLEKIDMGEYIDSTCIEVAQDNLGEEMTVKVLNYED